jgi:hypothetical protein
MWRVVVCASLVLAYFGFVGEAIHCQYFADPHQAHGGSSSKPISHATHCLVANHGTSAAIHSDEASGDPPAQQFAFVLTPDDTSHESGVFLSKAARGPPAA